jgi:hypothetical protein
MPTIEVKAIIVRCRAEDCIHNEKGYCAKEDGEILLDYDNPYECLTTCVQCEIGEN